MGLGGEELSDLAHVTGKKMCIKIWTWFVVFVQG